MQKWNDPDWEVATTEHSSTNQFWTHGSGDREREREREREKSQRENFWVAVTASKLGARGVEGRGGDNSITCMLLESRVYVCIS